MFDWEDQELAIIWGEADDHIVPYPEESERTSQPILVYNDNNQAREEPSNSKLSEQYPAATRTKLHEEKPESNGGLCFAATDYELNCIGKKIDFQKGSEISKGDNRVGEHNDFISNSWPNIGSFDDLDHIFSGLDGTWLPPENNFQTFYSQSFPDESNSFHHGNTLYQHISNPYSPVYSYGTDVEHGHVSTDKSTKSLMKNQNMTPQEKIEKLRRRHQIQAVLGIRKQQQQLSSEDHKSLHFERDDLEAEENMNTICSPSSPLYQLQNAANELDWNVKLCVRDSLFRLAQNAAERSDAMHLNRNSDLEVSILEEDISNQDRFMETPSAETETNCIDRAIAQLLFHQPLKSTSDQVYSKNLPGLK